MVDIIIKQLLKKHKDLEFVNSKNKKIVKFRALDYFKISILIIVIYQLHNLFN